MIYVVLYCVFIVLVLSIFVDERRLCLLVSALVAVCLLSYGLYAAVDSIHGAGISNTDADLVVSDTNPLSQTHQQLDALLEQEHTDKDIKIMLNLSTDIEGALEDQGEPVHVDLFAQLLKSGWIGMFAIFLSKGLTLCVVNKWWPFNESRQAPFQPAAVFKGLYSIWIHVAICTSMICARIYVGGDINPFRV